MKNLKLTVLALALLASCQPKSDKQTEEKSAATAESSDALREVFFANLVHPKEVAAGLESTAADFNQALLSDPSKASQYITTDVKAAANLGIYLSDMNYCIAYKKSDLTTKYFEAARSLANVMGLEKNVLDFLGKRYADNLKQNDSVKAVFDQFYTEASSRLKGTEKERLIGISIAAYQIENLHLLLGIIKSYPKDMLPDDARATILVPVLKQMLRQGAQVEQIYGFLRIAGNPENPNYYYYSNAFQELITAYGKLNVKETINNNEGVALLKDEVIADLNTKVDAIRDKAMQVQ